MRTTDPVLSPPISGAANAGAVIANVVMAFPGILQQFVSPAPKERSRHDSNCAPDISQRSGHDPGSHPVTLCLPLAPLPAAAMHQASRTASAQPGWPGPGKDRSGLWLRNAAAGLCVLAAAAAAVSFTAQYRMVGAVRHLPVIAALEASIPDVAALVFACLGVALALHGRRAIRPRALNLAAVGTSVFMNAIAAAPGWRNLAIWAMPPSPTPWLATLSSPFLSGS